MNLTNTIPAEIWQIEIYGFYKLHGIILKIEFTMAHNNDNWRLHLIDAIIGDMTYVTSLRGLSRILSLKHAYRVSEVQKVLDKNWPKKYGDCPQFCDAD